MLATGEKTLRGRGGAGAFTRQEAFIVITVNDLMAAISLFWNTNMAAVTSCEKALCEQSLSSCNLVPRTSRLPRPLDAILSDMAIWSTLLAGYEELAGGFESIKNDWDD